MMETFSIPITQRPIWTKTWIPVTSSCLVAYIPWVAVPTPKGTLKMIFY